MKIKVLCILACLLCLASCDYKDQQKFQFRKFIKDFEVFMKTQQDLNVISYNFYLPYLDEKVIIIGITSRKKLTPLEGKQELFFIIYHIIKLANKDPSLLEYFGGYINLPHVICSISDGNVFAQGKGGLSYRDGAVDTNMEHSDLFAVRCSKGSLTYEFRERRINLIHEFNEEDLKKYFPHRLNMRQ